MDHASMLKRIFAATVCCQDTNGILRPWTYVLKYLKANRDRYNTLDDSANYVEYHLMSMYVRDYLV